MLKPIYVHLYEGYNAYRLLKDFYEQNGDITEPTNEQMELSAGLTEAVFAHLQVSFSLDREYWLIRQAAEKTPYYEVVRGLGQ